MPPKRIPCLFHTEIHTTLEGGITVRYSGKIEMVGVQFRAKSLRKDHTQDTESMKPSH